RVGKAELDLCVPGGSSSTGVTRVGWILSRGSADDDARCRVEIDRISYNFLGGVCARVMPIDAGRRVRAGGRRPMRPVMIGFVLTLAGAAAGLATGYLLWDGRPNWYAIRDIEKLSPGRQNDLAAYGYQLITNTQRYLGPEAVDTA